MSIAAVILAAGASSRFGLPKASVRIGARTMLQVVVDTATAAGLDPIVVVAPSSMAVPEHALAVRNAAPERGMSLSLQMGIGAVPPDAEAAVVLLADQPTVDVAHLRGLDGRRGGTPVVATRSDGVLGPPILLERDGFSLVDGLRSDEGLRRLLRADPSLVTPVDHEPIPDVDTLDDLERITEQCPGCGAPYLPHVLDETHPYIGASSACWATFGELLAREFQDPAYGIVHRHTVDAYAAQHPGEDGRRERQSVALHLIAICHWLEHGLTAVELNPTTQDLASVKGDWPRMTPSQPYGMTVVDVLGARNGDEHARLVRGWAASVWEAYAAYHAIVRQWAAEVREGV